MQVKFTDPASARFNRHEFIVKQDRERAQRFAADCTFNDDGVLVNKIGRIVSPSQLDELGLIVPNPEKQAEAYDKSTQAFFAEYRKQDHTLTGEALFEARAAFGEGATVVNVITGRKQVL